MTDVTTPEITNCDFCNKPRDQVFRLVTNEKGNAICNECVSTCVNIINAAIDELKLPQIKYHS